MLPPGIPFVFVAVIPVGKQAKFRTLANEAAFLGWEFYALEIDPPRMDGVNF
jgi:uncharacterized protein YbaA (DUF1428 family)